MSFAILQSRARVGIAAPSVTVEVHISGGLPKISIVGLPETAVKESKDRVRSALLNMNFDFPAMRVTINLAPADLPKEGGRFDLPIALGILSATGQLPPNVFDEYEFGGELALSGELRPFKGALSFAVAAKANKKILVLPDANAEEASLVEGLQVLSVKHFLEVVSHFCGREKITPYIPLTKPIVNIPSIDLSQVRGQPAAKRAIEIAACGGHSMLLSGPPGSGKTMLANCLSGLLPLMNERDALESAMIASISSQGFHSKHWRVRAFRSPHHSASSVALVGGGSPPRPGEISLAHHGVLFMDELPEFNRHVLEALREPLESGVIRISRAAHQAEFPAKFQLIAAMNPCPCGYLGDSQRACRCSPEQVQRYHHKISGPILDRIDMHLQVARVPLSSLTQTEHKTENSQMVSARVLRVQARQYNRAGCLNVELTAENLDQCCCLNDDAKTLLGRAAEKFKLSARAYYRVLKVALTIADMADDEMIKPEHLGEALSYRQL
ncbi:MAG: ATP-dependent protease [Legionellaceae bacterium]|nr:ATP-dependent protease [Legionellaceae bacterium]